MNSVKIFFYEPGLTNVAQREIGTGSAALVASKSYRYDNFKQGIIDYNIQKMLANYNIAIGSAFASPVVLCRKNNRKSSDNREAWTFAIDYLNMKAITQYSLFPIPVIEEIVAYITSTIVMSTLDLNSKYFERAMKSEDIAEADFITSNERFAFKSLSFGLSGAPSSIQEAVNTSSDLYQASVS